jgi:phospholipid/cholesterol/gamma-HCH transport system substrate-binding protein
MSKRLHKPTLIVTLALWVGAAFLFVVFNNAFGGPQIGFSTPYRVSAFIADSQNLLTRSVVLERGVQVGYVDGVELAGNRTRFTIGIDGRYAPVYRDATLSVGHRTLFGEAYVDLNPGERAAGALPTGSVLPANQVVPVVNIDQALELLDTTGRRHLTSLARTTAQVNGDPDAARLFNGTLAGIGDTLTQVRRLSALLGDQQGNITQIVSSGRVVLDTLATREQQIATLVSGGRTALEGLTSNEAALRAGVSDVPALLASAKATLAQAMPLVRDATPVIETLGRAAPLVTRTAQRLPAVASSATSLVAALPAFRTAAVPVLRLLLGVSRSAGPAVTALQPALQNLIPIILHLAPYKRELVAFAANSGAGDHQYDLNGTVESHVTAAEAFGHPHAYGTLPLSWARFQIVVQPDTILNRPDPTVSYNPYPPPGGGDALFEPGDYGRLGPYPLPRSDGRVQRAN